MSQSRSSQTITEKSVHKSHATRVLAVALALFVCGLPATADDVMPARAAIVYVDDDNTAGPWDGSPAHPYQYIQDAITHAASGDIVYVLAGTYNENLLVNRTLTLLGEDADTTVIASVRDDNIVRVTADDVELSGFTIRCTIGDCGWGGVYTTGDHSTIHDNRFENADHAVYAEDALFTAVRDNLVLANKNGDGVYLRRSDYGVVSGNTFVSCDSEGVVLSDALCNSVIGNIVSQAGFFGVYLRGGSSYNVVAGNTIEDGRNGIYVSDSPHNLLHENVLVGNEFEGVSLGGSADVTVTDNIMGSGGGIRFDHMDTLPEYWDTHVIERNTVNGAPVYYLLNQDGVVAPSDAAQVILVGCTNATIDGLVLDQAIAPIQMAFCDGCTVRNCVVRIDRYTSAITLMGSTDALIAGNTLTSTYWIYSDNLATWLAGVLMVNGSDSTVVDNVISGFNHGILLANSTASDNQVIAANVLTNNSIGFWLIRYGSTQTNTTMAGNLIADSWAWGLALAGWPDVSIRNNEFLGCGLSLGGTVEDWTGHTVQGNAVNGKPLYYFVDRPDIVVPPDGGQVVLAHCPNAVVDGLEIENTSIAVLAGYCDGLHVENCRLAHNATGVEIRESSATVCRNNVLVDNDTGVILREGSGHQLAANRFIDLRERAVQAGEIASSSIVGNTLTATDDEHRWGYGFNLSLLDDCLISDNTVTCAVNIGLYLGLAQHNTLTRNAFAHCGRYGVFLDFEATENDIYENEFVDNDTNAYERYAQGNHWSVAGVGNFWSDFASNPGYPGSYEVPGEGDGDGVDTAPLPALSSCPGLCGDIDVSCGAVDFADATQLFDCWDLSDPTAPDCLCADLDADGEVNLSDFAAFGPLYGTHPVSAPPDCVSIEP